MRLDPSEVTGALAVLAGATSPCLLVGPWAEPAMNDVVELAKLLGAPVLTTPDAKSLFDESSVDSGGVFSFGAPKRARAIVEATDAVVAIGTNLGELATQSGTAFARAAIVHVTDDPSDMPLGVKVRHTLLGDVRTTLRALLSRIEAKAPVARWFDRLLLRDRKPHPAAEPSARCMDPTDAILAIGASLPARARVVCDITSANLQVLHFLELSPERRLWIQTERSCCMGTSLAAGLGIRLASGLPTVVIMGDWGFFMGNSELHTAASLGIGGFAIVIWSNAGGALVRTGVRAQRIDVTEDTHSWPAPRFDSIAEACGMRALSVRTAKGLRRAAASALRAPYPVLIDAQIDPDAVPPGASDRYIHLDESMQTR